MKKIINNRYVLYGLGIIFLFGLWFLISFIVGNNSTIFPNPAEVLAEMFRLLGVGQTYKYLAFSVVRLVVGFALSFLLAFVIGLIVNDSDRLYNFFNPIITFFKAAPTVVFVYLFIVLSGSKNAPIYVVVSVTFPILYESIVGGFRSTDKAISAQAQVDGAGKLKRLLFIQLPCGVPYIEVGIMSTFALAFKIEIMAEVITGYTNGGIGSIIKTSQLLDPTNLTTIFAYSLMAIIVILIVSVLSDLTKAKHTRITVYRRAMGVKN